jgi:hypothetical protein
MSDVKVIRALLLANAPLIAAVPALKIIAGSMPEGTSMPAIAITHVGRNWGQEISKQSRWVLARTQVTVMASTYPDQKRLIDLVLAAIPRRPGVVNSVKVDHISRESGGPDFEDDAASIYMQTQDFMVAYNE